MNNIIYASFFESNAGWLIPLILVAFFGVIVLVVILIKKHSNVFKNPEDKPKSESEVAEEEVNRVLEEVDDEETAKQMEQFAKEQTKKPEENKDEPKGEDKPVGK